MDRVELSHNRGTAAAVPVGTRAGAPVDGRALRAVGARREQSRADASDDRSPSAEIDDLITDRVRQVGLPHAARPMDEERVVFLARLHLQNARDAIRELPRCIG